MKWIVTLWAALIGVAVMGQSTVRRAPNLATLQSQPPSAVNPTVFVEGLNGGFFTWNASSVVATNAVDRIAYPYGSATGRYLRQVAMGGVLDFDSTADLTFLDLKDFSLDGQTVFLQGVQRLDLVSDDLYLSANTNLSILTPQMNTWDPSSVLLTNRVLTLVDPTNGYWEAISLDELRGGSGVEASKLTKWNTAKQLVSAAVDIADVSTVVDSVSALVALDPTDRVAVRTLGYTTAGDGGGAIYRWASGYSGTTNALGGALAVAGGAWVQLGDEINAKQFGAVGDGTTDDTDALQAMLEWSEGRHAIIPDGTYYTTKASLEALPYFGLSFRNNSTVEWRGGMVTLETNVAVRHIFCGRSPGASTTNVTILNPQIDAQNSKANLLGFAWGGSEATSVRDIKIIGGTLLNAKHDPEINGLGGGRAITFQFGVRDCIVEGVTVRGCHTAFDVHGNDNEVGKEVRRVIFANCAVYDCEFVGTVVDLADPGEPTTNEGRNILSVVFTGITFENCGLSEQSTIGELAFERVNNAGNADPFVDYYQAATTYLLNWELEPYSAAFAEWDPAASYSIGDKVKITDNGRFGAVFGILTGTGVLIEGVRGFNSDDYGTVGAFVRGDGSNIHVADCQLGINVESLIWLGHNRNIWPIVTRYFARPSNWVVNNLSNTGTNEVVVKATLPVDIAGQAPLALPLSPRQIWLGGLKLYPDGMTQIVDDSLEVTASQNLQDWMTWMEVWNWKNGGRISGSFGNIYQNANALTDVNSADRYGFKDVRTRPIHIETYQSNNQLRLQRNGSASGTANLWVNSGILNSDVPLSLQASGTTIRAGTGSPIGAVSAAVGSIYQQSDVTDGQAVWVKYGGGTGNTGWQRIGQPATATLTTSSGDVTVTGGNRSVHSHYWAADGHADLVFSSVVDGDTGTLLVWAASTNVTLTLTDSFAYSPSGSTLTVTGGTNNWSVIAWEARTINSNNVVLVNLGDYSR